MMSKETSITTAAASFRRRITTKAFNYGYTPSLKTLLATMQTENAQALAPAALREERGSGIPVGMLPSIRMHHGLFITSNRRKPNMALLA